MNPRLTRVAIIIAPVAAVAWLVVVAPGATPAAAPAPVAFERATIERGRALALLGNCNACHTAEGGRTFAGGRPLATPFGTIYSTNITPEAQTGIGRWSGDDFRRAMREGVAPDGRQLYPVFPYDHFALMSDADIDAVYAYLMTRAPLQATPPRNALRPPFGFRPLVGVWKLLYFRPRPLADDPAQSVEWNRGRYLVDGVAHCGACHTPRNAHGAEEREHDLGGGDAEGWHAPALDESSPAPVRWTVDALIVYLRSGFDARHGASRGPMAPVARNLALAPEPDVRAIAVYVASRAGRSNVGSALAVTRQPIDSTAPAPPDGGDEGALLYEGACASCHDTAPTGVQLEHSTAVTDVVPTNIVRVITDGLRPLDGEASRAMPGFRGALTAAQTAALVRYIRERYSRAPPWRDVEAEVAKVRDERPEGGAS
jgi:mono/diheme cytochrome c family protein